MRSQKRLIGALTWLHGSSRRLIGALVLGLALGVLAPLSAQTLQLADGQVLLASVEDAYGEGLRVQRLDNGGQLELRWEHLSADCAQRVKVAFGLVGEDQGELLTTVSEIRYLQNGSPQTLLGRIVDQSSTSSILVQQKGVQYPIPRAEIQQMRTVEVPVSQVFTPDEFYNQRLAEVAPGDVADKHRQLAEDLVRVRDYQRALEHLKRAKELGNARAPEQIDQMMTRVNLYIAAAQERRVIDEIAVARARGSARDFENGLKLIAQFEKDYPNSKLKGEFETEKRRFADARQRLLSQQVADMFRRGIAVVADKLMQEPGITLQAARQYAESKMTDDIVALTAQRLKLDAKEVVELWGVREKFPAGRRSENFSYGLGSWVLGEKAITLNTQQAAAGAAPKTTQAQKDLERLAQAIQKAREAQRAQAKGQGAGGKEQTEDEWWNETERPERGNWLRAYYAEFGGQLKMVGAYNQVCINCAGLGTTSEMGPGNKVIKVPCYLCHNTKWTRSFKAF